MLSKDSLRAPCERPERSSADSSVNFFEDMANCPDPNVHKDLVGISIIEPLVAHPESTRQAWKYMGHRTKELTRSEAREQGREQNLPPA